MDAIVCPDAPIVVGFSLGVLTVLIVQEGDHLVQHRFSNRKARAKGRACKVESEVSTDSVFRNKIFEAPSGARIRIVWHRRSCGNDACSSLQAPLMYMTA